MATKNRIFLAHASEDKPRVQQLYNQLKKQGFSPWLDAIDLIPGQNWEIEIPKAIKRASVCLVCLSKSSVAKKSYVQREFRYALLAYAELPPESIYLIPVRLDDCEVPDLQIPDLELKLRSIHWVDLFETTGFEHLVSAIGVAVEPTKRYQPLSKEVPDPTTKTKPPRLPGFRQKPVIITALVVVVVVALSGFLGSLLLNRDTGVNNDQSSRDENTSVPLATKSEIGVNDDQFSDEKNTLDRRVWKSENDIPRVIESESDLYDNVDPAGNVTPGPEPLTVFRDCNQCPEMVMLPTGKFLMGSPVDEEDRYPNEGPQHEVDFTNRFAIGKTEVTFDNYDRFTEATGREISRDADLGRGERPVFDVSFDDARAYCTWLGEQTGKSYRLPTEAEWEYAARAGSTTPFSFGEMITPEQVNYNGNAPYIGGEKGLDRANTVPAGSLPANPWGLHEMHGNVYEWVEDWYHDDYRGAPTDGSAWLSPQGTNRVVRGGSWYHGARMARAAYRSFGTSGYGFRCVRVQKS